MDYNLFYKTTEYPSAATSELDFVQHWVEQTVEKEIVRGHQLQQLKARTPVVQEYDVVNVDNGTLPFCEPSSSQKNSKSTKKPKKHIHKSKKGKQVESVSTCRRLKSNRKRKITQKCPMRIAELAVPTKRQCLQNWINNKDILPEIMIHRLQQIVRDQRPVVKLSDAIHCFKIHRQKKKSKSKEFKKKDKKCLAKTLNEAKNLSDARVFCGIFGHRIKQILNKPMVIELSTELERLATVVTMDIADLLYKNHPNFRNIGKTNEMLDVTASKIAIWIWSILEDANNLILEEQLKELENEIGPVLDIIDDLIDNVVDICYVEPIYEAISSESSTNVESLAQEEEVAEVHRQHGTESKKELHTTHTFADLDELSDDIHDYVINQISSIINYIGDDDTDLVSKVSYDENLRGNLGDEKSSQQSLDDKEFVDADDHNDDNDSKPETDPSEQIENPGHPFELEERAEEGNQVSDDFNDGKKVTFSQLNTVTNTNSNDVMKMIMTRSEDDGDYGKILHWKTSLNKIVFSEPNDHLLSDVDELWPHDIKYEEYVKTAVNINKSISSMGQIFETEERAAEAPTEDLTDHYKIEHLHEQELDAVKIVNTTSTTTKLNILYKEIAESKAVQTSIDKSNFDYNKKIRETGINTSPSSSTTSKRKKGKTVTSLSLADFSKKPTDKDAKFNSVGVKPSLNNKVSPHTATAWAKHGFYEASEGSRHKRQINQFQIRKWCNNLQTGYDNLRLWGNWLDESSRIVTELQQNKAKCCLNKRKHATKWMKLKKELDYDASIWNKTHRCTKKQFAEHKKMYCDILVPKINCKCSKYVKNSP